MLDSSLVNKSLQLLQLLALAGLSRQVPHGRLNKPVSLMEMYVEQRVFFSANGSSPALANSLPSSIRVNSNVMGVVRYHFESNVISLSCSCFRRTVS